MNLSLVKSTCLFVILVCINRVTASLQNLALIYYQPSAVTLPQIIVCYVLLCSGLHVEADFVAHVDCSAMCPNVIINSATS